MSWKAFLFLKVNLIYLSFITISLFLLTAGSRKESSLRIMIICAAVK